MTQALGIAGGIVSAVGHQLAAEQSAKIMEANAAAAKKDAEYARLAAAVDAEYIQEEGRAAQGRARAIVAGQGAETTSGSPLAGILDMVGKSRRAVMRRQFVGEVEAAKFLTEAEFFKTKASSARIMGAINSFASVLGGASVGGYDTSGRSTGGFRSESAYQQQRAGERADYSGSDSGSFSSGGDWDSGAGGAL
jgi:hypothetical protein